MFGVVRRVGFQAVVITVTITVGVGTVSLVQAEEADYPEELSEHPEDGQEPFAWSDAGEGVPEALALYQRSEELYDQGRYQEAVVALLRVIELDPDAPELYYNIALAYEHLTEFDQALEYLNRYLQYDIGDEERARVERMMARVRGARAYQPPTPDSITETRVVVQRVGLADAWFWAMVGTTIFFAGGAAVTGGFALSWANAADADEFTLGRDGDHEEQQRWVHVADSLTIATDVLVGAASATAIAALLLYVLRTHPVVEESGEIESGEGDGGAQQTSRSRPSGATRLIPTIQVGVGSVMIGWEL